MPAIPKVFLISDEVFVIAGPPKVQEKVEQPRLSESSSAPSTYSRLSGVSSQTSNSWVDNPGSPVQDEMSTFQVCDSEPEPEHIRSSLDEIDDQMVLNLCLNLCDEKPARIENAHGEKRAHRRSASLRAAQPTSLPPAQSAKSTHHVRMHSAPLSLGPLPPQPTQPPTEAVLRKTDQIKKRYSKQQSSPLLTSSSPLMRSSEDSFPSPRPAPGTPKLDSISSLKSLEAGLSLDSKLVKRKHKRSASKHSSRTTVDAVFGKDVRLTPGHVATFFDEPAMELVSRFSEDSEDGEDARRLFAKISPKLGVAKFASSFASSSSGHSNTVSALEMTRLDGDASGARTPEMVATRNSSSSSSSSSLSDLSDLTTAEEAVFDLSRPSLDYAAVYALAQKYAQTSSTPTVSPVVKKPSLKSQSKPSTMRSLLTSSASRSQRHLPDPVDRSYHLRKY